MKTIFLSIALFTCLPLINPQQKTLIIFVAETGVVGAAGGLSSPINLIAKDIEIADAILWNNKAFFRVIELILAAGRIVLGIRWKLLR